MADINVAAGGIGTADIVLVANAVQIVNFADPLSRVDVVNVDGTAKVRWTCDGATPSATVGYPIPATVAVDSRQPRVSVADNAGTVVKLWSAGTPTVAVVRGDRDD